jgi:sugar (pentulose or hexulose) kinase
MLDGTTDANSNVQLWRNYLARLANLRAQTPSTTAAAATAAAATAAAAAAGAVQYQNNTP